MGEQIEVNYVMQGERGRTCADCKFYEPGDDNPGMGTCHGHEVVAAGGCDFFQPKD